MQTRPFFAWLVRLALAVPLAPAVAAAEDAAGVPVVGDGAGASVAAVETGLLFMRRRSLGVRGSVMLSSCSTQTMHVDSVGHYLRIDYQKQPVDVGFCFVKGTRGQARVVRYRFDDGELSVERSSREEWQAWRRGLGAAS